MIAQTRRLRAGRTLTARPAMLALPAALALASCATAPKAPPPPPPPPPPLETITVPLPQNLPAEPPSAPIPKLPITQSEGEDLWHLRSGLNVAALVCDNKTFTQLIPGYNAMLRTHKALLLTAATTEIAQFRANGRDWQARYDTHMTKVYNSYSVTQERARFCDAASGIVGEAADLASDVLAKRATEFLARIDFAAAPLPAPPPPAPAAIPAPAP